MKWQDDLTVRIEALGDNPSKDQCDNLVSWVMENVPRDYLSSVAQHLPGDAHTDISMRCGEMGI